MHKLLMITIELPFPPSSGGRMKSWNMLQFLSRHYEVGLACPLKYGTAELAAFGQATRLRHFLHEQVEIPRSGRSLLQSYASGVPINVWRSHSQTLRRAIEAVIHEYDVVLLDHYESSWYLPANYQGKVVFHTHNATYLMWERYAQSDAIWTYRIVTWLEARRVKAYERQACAKADLIFASPNDIDNLVVIGADRRKFRETYHLGDDSQLELPALAFDRTEESLLYVGTLNWEANIDGLLWFFAEVWPLVRQKHPNIRMDVVGGKPDPRLLEAAKGLAGITFTGFVDELEPYFARARLFLAPLRFGSGIKVKVLNAMCRGLPTITTPVGAEGLVARHMEHLSITETPQDMADSIHTLLTDAQAWAKLERQSRELVREKYTWKRVLGYMVEQINGLFSQEKSS